MLQTIIYKIYEITLISFVLFCYLQMLLPALTPLIFCINRYLSRNIKVEIGGKFPELPVITVQLPVYNDAHVCVRCIQSLTEADYPKDKLYIQVLDDSTEAESTETVQKCVHEVKNMGFDIEYMTRQDRVGHKAGNLSHGLKKAKGDIVAIFDSDSIVPQNFFTGLIHYFTDPNVAFVQGRKSAINENENIITKVDSVNVDAEHMIQQIGTNRLGYFITFNGSGGMWRKSIIENLGGWSLHSLAEDRDLSYRSFIQGYRAVYDPSVNSKEEVPSSMDAQRVQKSRWFLGTSECSKDYFFPILKSKLDIGKKFNAIFLMLSHLLGVIHPIFTTGFLFLIVATTYGYFPMIAFSGNPYLLYGVTLFGIIINFIYLYLGQALANKKFSFSDIMVYSLFSMDFWGDLIMYYNYNEPKSSEKLDFKVTPKSGVIATDPDQTKKIVEKYKYPRYPLQDVLEFFLLLLIIYNPNSYYLIPFLILQLPFLSIYLYFSTRL